MTQSTSAVAQSGTFAIGGDLPVHRLGYGVMQLPGPGVWGPPRDHDEAIRVLRRVVELGVNLIDTADSYGPFVADHLIREALHPYPEGLVIATKVGFTRQGPSKWVPVGRPEYLRQQVELNLRHLGLERIDLLQLHRIDRKVPLEDQIGELAALQTEGKIRHIGLSEVPVENIAFIPWFPLATGELAGEGSPVAKIAAEKGVSPSQLALAWLLHSSPVILPIPGTSSVAHLEDNVAAAGVSLTDDEMAALTAAAG
jgi:pyridoxine 4-dehydrogenase